MFVHLYEADVKVININATWTARGRTGELYLGLLIRD
jgi:hypothetical protein